MSSRKHRSQSARSTMEETFIANSTLKRNKRYLDIKKINNFESEIQVKRRRPISTANTVDFQIQKSFLSSTSALTNRLDQDITKFKQRISVDPNHNCDERQEQAVTERPTRCKSSNSARGVSLEKHLSRDQYYGVRNKAVLDERLFNNFSFQKADVEHTPSLGKGPERNFDSSLKHINDLYIDTQKLYEQYYYKRINMKCKFNYKTQKTQDRYYFTPKRQDGQPQTDLSPKAVRKAFYSVLQKPGSSEGFYSNSGRDFPCQLDNRLNNSLTNFYVDENHQVKRVKLEFSQRKMKSDLETQRIEKIQKSKKAHFKRKQICDKKYFSMKQDEM